MCWMLALSISIRLYYIPSLRNPSAPFLPLVSWILELLPDFSIVSVLFSLVFKLSLEMIIFLFEHVLKWVCVCHMRTVGLVLVSVIDIEKSSLQKSIIRKLTNTGCCLPLYLGPSLTCPCSPRGIWKEAHPSSSFLPPLSDAEKHPKLGKDLSVAVSFFRVWLSQSERFSLSIQSLTQIFWHLPKLVCIL